MPRKLVFLFALCLLFIGILGSMALGANPGSNDNSGPIIIDRTDYPVLYPSTPNLQGEAVWMLQARLQELGYDVVPNGQYNASTWKAVSMYQVAHGFEDNATVTQPIWESLLLAEQSEPCATEEVKTDNKRIMIVIDVAKLNLTVLENDKAIVTYPVAVGKASTPTPLGEWKIIHKSVNWGNGFGTRWMGLNVPWGIYGIHGTNKPGSIGSYASHGCIRMFNRDVEKLYPLIPWGTTVRIVKNGRIVPENFTPPPSMKKGSSGQKVVYVQSRLKELGVIFDAADGRYGPMTEFAVKYYQAWHGLPITGEMDEATYRSMGLIK
ncbi:MAG TPA: peptidoglycan-binding protein [Syntrophomonadaceae bacterium]|nr:peptidoglycan-binding protein [Syntrophomonadaceae bacterium]HQE22784.1 peptidoglycan-binding protein [Syntrophomonadaceae bacterium]